MNLSMSCIKSKRYLLLAKITFINQVTGPMMIDIVNDFAYRGDTVTLITGQIEQSTTAISPKVQVKTFQRYLRKTPPLRISTWVYFFLQTFFFLLFQNKSSLVFLVSNPPFLPFLGGFFYLIKRQPYAVLIYDIYPDILLSSGIAQKNAVWIRWWRALNRYVYRHATQVFTLSSGMGARLSAAGAKSPIITPPWADSTQIKPLEKSQNPFAIAQGQVDKLTILYSGNFGKTHPVERILDIAKALRTHTNIHFLLIGRGEKEPSLRALKIEWQLDNVTILDFLPPDQLKYSLPCGDISIVTLDEASASMSVPSKTFYMMAAGSAILALSGPESEVSELCTRYQCGVTVSPQSPQDAARFILEMASSPETLLRYRENARAAGLSFTAQNALIYRNSLTQNSDGHIHH